MKNHVCSFDAVPQVIDGEWYVVGKCDECGKTWGDKLEDNWMENLCYVKLQTTV